MAGEERWPVLELPGARPGSTDLTTQKAVLMEGQAPASVDVDGLLGVTSLGVRRITFDFEHNTIRWEPRQHRIRSVRCRRSVGPDTCCQQPVRMSARQG